MQLSIQYGTQTHGQHLEEKKLISLQYWLTSTQSTHKNTQSSMAIMCVFLVVSALISERIWLWQCGHVRCWLEGPKFTGCPIVSVGSMVN